MNNPFKKPTPELLVKQELEYAKRDLLLSESNVEYWTYTRDMLKQRIARLENTK